MPVASLRSARGLSQVRTAAAGILTHLPNRQNQARMDPDSSPSLCEQIPGICRSFPAMPAEEFLELTSRPADTLVPALLLGVAVMIFCLRENTLPRFGMDGDAYRVPVLGLLLVAVLIAGIGGVQPGDIDMGLAIVFAYGIPAIVAVVVGFVVGTVIDSLWLVPTTGTSPLDSGPAAGEEKPSDRP